MTLRRDIYEAQIYWFNVLIQTELEPEFKYATF